MYLSTFVLCVTMALLLHGATCRLYPQVIDSLTHPSDDKRQISAQAQCITDKVIDAFQGKPPSAFYVECLQSAIREFELFDLGTTDTSDLQNVANVIYRTFCVPECGNVILQAYDDCGVFENLMPSRANYKEIIVSLCGTNHNGDTCYQMYGDAIAFAGSEVSCYDSFRESGDCSCRSILTEGVSEQGCCINIYHDLDIAFGIYNPRELYESCNVTLPSDCSNSPLELNEDGGKSDSMPHISVAPTVTMSLSCALLSYIE